MKIVKVHIGNYTELELMKIINLLLMFLEALSSDEDEIDDLSNSYLENLENFATQKASEIGLQMNSEIKVCFTERSFCAVHAQYIFLY